MFELDHRPVKELADSELSAELVALQHQIEQIRVRQLEVAGEWDVRGLWAFAGCAKAPQWLTAHAAMPRSEARSFMWLARQLRLNMPLTAEAVRVGRISLAQARVLAGAVTPRTEAAFVEQEKMLVDAAAGMTVEQLPRFADRWKQLADDEGPVGRSERLRARRFASLSLLSDGMWRLDAWLDPEGGAILKAELDHIGGQLWRSEDPEATDDVHAPRTGPQRRADALVEMVRRSSVAHDQTPGAQPLLLVRTDVETLAGGEGESSVGNGEIPIPADAARRLACDCALVRVVMGADSEVLDMGRAVRTATINQKRSLVLRDGPSCVVPSCDVPVEFCQAHHLDWWDNGGPTDLANLAMVCHRHHHSFHEGKWTLTREPDRTFVAHPPPERQ